MIIYVSIFSVKHFHIWVLKLNNEICVTADANHEFNSAVERIAEVQLVFNSDQLVKYHGL